MRRYIFELKGENGFETYVVEMGDPFEHSFDVAVFSRPSDKKDRKFARTFRDGENTKLFIVSGKAGNVREICDLITKEIENVFSPELMNGLSEADCKTIFGGKGYGFFATGIADPGEEDLTGKLKVITDGRYKPKKIKCLLVSFTGAVSVTNAAKAADIMAKNMGAEECIICLTDNEQETARISVFG